MFSLLSDDTWSDSASSLSDSDWSIFVEQSDSVMILICHLDFVPFTFCSLLSLLIQHICITSTHCHQSRFLWPVFQLSKAMPSLLSPNTSLSDYLFLITSLMFLPPSHCLSPSPLICKPMETLPQLFIPCFSAKILDCRLALGSLCLSLYYQLWPFLYPSINELCLSTGKPKPIILRWESASITLLQCLIPAPLKLLSERSKPSMMPLNLILL